LWDLAKRLWGKRHHDLNWKSRSGAHRGAPEAASEIKAQVVAKLHLY
jgi:hypothetical protein